MFPHSIKLLIFLSAFDLHDRDHTARRVILCGIFEHEIVLICWSNRPGQASDFITR
jgi:hypothetical protein